MLVAIQLDNWHCHVGVPDENIELESAADYDLVFLAVGHFAHGSRVTYEVLNWLNRLVTVNIFLVWMVFKVVLDLCFHLFLESLLSYAAIAWLVGIWIVV